MLDIGFNRFLSPTVVSVAGVVALVIGGFGLLASIVVGVYNFSSDSLNRTGMSGDSNRWEGWSHARKHVTEVSAGAA